MTDESKYIFFRHGPFQIDLVRECLNLDGKPQTLRHQSFQVLRYLVCHPLSTVTKDELQSEIWKDTCVTDNALVQCIAEIRRALRDDPKAPTFIKTIPKIGYRFLVQFEFVSEVELEELPEVNSAAPSQPATSLVLHSLAHRLEFRIVAICCVLLLVLGLSQLGFPRRIAGNHRKVEASSPSPVKKNVRIESLKDETGASDSNWADSGLPEMLAANLRNIPGIEIATSDSEKNAPPVLVAGALRRQNNSYSLRIETRAPDGHLLGSDLTLTDSDKFPLTASLLASMIADHLGISLPESMLLKEEAATTDSVDAAEYYEQGVLAAKHFQTKQATELLKKAIKLDPRFAMAYARIGYTYAVADFAPQQGIPYLHKAAELSNALTEKQKLYIAAWQSTAEGKYDEAVRVYTSLSQQFPHDPESFLQLAKLQRSLEQMDGANATLKRGLEFNPNNASLINVKAVVELAQHRYPEAIASAQEYLRLRPDEANAHDTLGMSYQQAGKLYQAIAEFSAALSLDPEFEPAIVHMGDAYFQAGQYEKSILQYRHYIEAAHTDAAKAIGYGDLSTVYREQGNFNEAAVAAEREIHYDPHAIWNSLVIALHRGQTAKVREYEAKLQITHPSQERGTPGDRRTVSYQQGWLALQRGDQSKALASFQEALRHVPASSGIDLHNSCLADAFMQLGMPKKAEEEYRRLLANNPDDPFALRGIHAIVHTM